MEHTILSRIRDKSTQAGMIQAKAERVLALCELLRSAELRIGTRKELAEWAIWKILDRPTHYEKSIRDAEAVYHRVESMVKKAIHELDTFIQKS
ncbi:MAG: hypothetical protein PHS30_04730 [Bacteroidales bacterium]|nr:hypothetical protein [Bacteroidales bacterium]